MVSTPGPANMLLMGSVAQHGFVKCVNFMLGLASGIIFLNIAIPLAIDFCQAFESRAAGGFLKPGYERSSANR